MIGGGEIAARKTALLLKADAQVTVISPDLCPRLFQLKATGKIIHIEKEIEKALPRPWPK